MTIKDLDLAKNILVIWGATSEQIQKVLPSECASEAELSDRVYSILTIREYINMTFQNPKNQVGFMTMKNHNSFFEGRTPLEVISSGRLDDLTETKVQIRHMGEW